MYALLRRLLALWVKPEVRPESAPGSIGAVPAFAIDSGKACTAASAPPPASRVSWRAIIVESPRPLPSVSDLAICSS